MNDWSHQYTENGGLPPEADKSEAGDRPKANRVTTSTLTSQAKLNRVVMTVSSLTVSVNR